MPTVSKTWDIVSLFEHYAGVQVVGGGSVVYGVLEFHGNCPWCPGSHDSFIMRPETGQYSHAVRVGGCGRTGDALDFLKDDIAGPGMSHEEAIETLGLEDVQFSDAESANKRHRNSDATMPSKGWMEAAMQFVRFAERYLWGEKGKAALAYLYERGLKDETIKKARLGYVPLEEDGKWYTKPFEKWGLDPEQLTEAQRAKGGVRIPNGILIPWFVGGEVWKLAVKRPGEQMDYGQVMGSKEPLYNVDALQYGEIAMMVEGEIDCLSVVQEAGDLVNCVATGSSAKGRARRWISELSSASFILQSFDEDESGDEGADFWLKTFTELENIARWSPMSWNDPNDLLQAQLRGETKGFTLRDWVSAGVQVARNAMNIDLVFPTLAREVQEELEIAPVSDIQSEPVEPDPAQEETQDDRLMLYADTVSQVVDEFGGPNVVKMTKHDGRSLEQTLRANAFYKPVTLPALPRKKCPHQLITIKRVSDELSQPVSGGLCKEKPLIHGWCDYHQGSYELLQLGAKLGYPEVNLGARWILEGVENWEAYAETISPVHVKQDIARIKARYDL